MRRAQWTAAMQRLLPATDRRRETVPKGGHEACAHRACHVVMEGALRKLPSGLGRGWQTRWFVLTDAERANGDAELQGRLHYSNPATGELKGIVALANVCEVRWHAHTKTNFELRTNLPLRRGDKQGQGAISKGRGKVYTLQAASEHERESWCTRLVKGIRRSATSK